MKSRKEMKAAAKRVLKEHYGILVLVCLVAAVLGSEFGSSLTTLKEAGQEKVEETVEGTTGVTDTAAVGSSAMEDQFERILQELMEGNVEESRKLAQEKIEEEKENSSSELVLGRTRGVLSTLVNQVTSGAFLVSLTVGIRSIVGSENGAVMLLIGLGMLFNFLVQIFLTGVYPVILRRMFLEGRCYEKLHTQRAMFLLKVRKWIRASLTMLLTTVYQLFWLLTIVGGIIKHYSYYLVPYIVAENPGIGSRQAITLSRKLMQGHKWQCFLFELSYLGWNILGALTFGLTDIFFTNPYKAAAFCEFYAELRRTGKENKVEGTEFLTDRYLFEMADEETRRAAYGDVLQEENSQKIPELTGYRKLLAKLLGLSLWRGKKEIAYEECQAKAFAMSRDKEALDGLIYPTRLHPLPEKNKRKWIEEVNYIRCYSLCSMILIFFIMAFMGWIWEVSLHLVTTGEFVNRGVLHGPWLPIYGTGSVLILLLLNAFRKHPALEFVSAVILCGCVEYFTAYHLEMTHGGKKWWDYSGYFLNLDGRICAEGLLTFGVGGMAIVYVLAPLLDNMIRKIPMKIVIPLCAVLLCLYLADQVYSGKHPNEGKGITDTAQAPETEWELSAKAVTPGCFPDMLWGSTPSAG